MTFEQSNTYFESETPHPDSFVYAPCDGIVLILTNRNGSDFLGVANKFVNKLEVICVRGRVFFFLFFFFFFLLIFFFFIGNGEGRDWIVLVLPSPHF